jgi:transposase
MSHLFYSNMKDIPQSIRERVIALHKHTTKTQREIGTDLGISHNAVGLIIRRYESEGVITTSRAGRCDRKLILTNHDKSFLIRESRKYPAGTAVELKVRCGTIHVLQLRRHCVKVGSRFTDPKKSHCLIGRSG